MRKTRVFCSGPISGHDFDERYAAFEKRTKLIRLMGYICHHPLEGLIGLRGSGIVKPTGYGGRAKGSTLVSLSDWNTRRADILLVDLAAAKKVISIGTVVEVSWAFRQASTFVVVFGLEEGDPMYHDFILEQGDLFLPTEEAAMLWLADHADA